MFEKVILTSCSLVSVQLIFRGVSYPNNSVLLLNDIGQFSTGSAILFTTNRSPCCSTNGIGEWYYPNGSLVPNNAAGQGFFRTRGKNQTIYLNRRNNAQSPTGSFCCELPDDSDVTHRLCVTFLIGMMVQNVLSCIVNTAIFKPYSELNRGYIIVLLHHVSNC